jgi:hypothetical protein
MTINRIITRGMGASRGLAGRAGMVTQGYGGFFRAVVKLFEPVLRVRRGRSAPRREEKELETIIIRAKLIEVNDSPPKKKVEGFIRVAIDRSKNVVINVSKNVSTRVKSIYEIFKVKISRIK